jgi:hypothetical protein
VYWHNPATVGLELCVVKTLNQAMEAYSDGWAGYNAAALREVAAMRRMAGVLGVPGVRDMVIDHTGTIHLVIE